MKQQLEQGLKQMDIILSISQQQMLLALLDALARWSQSINLTSITDPRQMVSHHLLDSLSVLPYICGPRVLDVGTGAGFPGLPLAIALPDIQFTLLDSAGKKIRFVRQMLHELNLANVETVNARVESFSDAQGFDTIISRAVSSAHNFVSKTKHLCAKDGQRLIMKGANPEAELADLQQAADIDKLDVPGISGERHIMILR